MRIGVVGNGMIVEWMFRDIKALLDVTAEAICVREKSLEKGRELADKNGVKDVYTDYGVFLEKGDFDTVYIGIANHMHYAYVKQALEAGKHVICEKPFTVTAQETRELSDLARAKRLFLWEAFKIPYSPIFQTVQEHLSDIGEIKMAQCNYSRISSRYGRYQAGEVLPAFDPECAGGCLYDINLYNLHFVTGLFGKPAKVHYFANRGYNGIDTSGTAILEYDGFHAVCTGAKDSSSPCYGLVQGTEGCIRVEGAVSSAPYVELITAKETRRLADDPENGVLTGEFREFAKQLHEGDLESCYKMLDHSVIMMEVVDEAVKDMKSSGAISL